MGRTLHNRIPLGRATVRDSRPLQAALALAALGSIGLVWLALRALA